MPTYVFRENGRYHFRRAVPAEIRIVIGKREVKKSLGPDYRAACSKALTLSVEVEKTFRDARAYLARHLTTIESRSLPKKQIHAITTELRSQLKSLWLSVVDSADVQRRASGFAHIGQAEIVAQTVAVSEIFRHALITGEVTLVLKPMTELLYISGYELAPALHGSQAERELAIDYARAYLAGVKLLEARDVGEDLPLPTTPALPNLESVTSSNETKVPIRLTGPSAGHALHSIASAAEAEAANQSTMLLSDSITQFLGSWSRGDAMRVKLVAVLDLFLTYTNDKPIVNLRQTHINTFFEFIQRLPPRWKDECRRRKLGVIELAKLDHAKTLGPKTFEDTYLAAFRLFLIEAKRNWQDIGFPSTLTTEGTHYSGKIRPGEYKQRAFTEQELKSVFEGESLKNFSQNESELHKYWLPVVALFTGARINELCQLNPQLDIAWFGDIFAMNITEDTESADGVRKSVKNQSSKRLIPAHKMLLELGFPDYVNSLRLAGAKQLFPAWVPYRGKASANAGKWHARWLQAQNVNTEVRVDGRQLRGSHAYRHTLLTYGHSAGLALWGVSGHSDSTLNPNANLVALGYIDEEIAKPLRAKQKELDGLDYGISIPMPARLKAETARRIIEEAKRLGNSNGV